MFFRKKRKDPADTTTQTASTGTAGASDAPLVPTSSGGDLGPPSTQFLTGEAGRDRRTVQVLLEAIARVSESTDLQSLFRDIVDRSIEITGAERGLLILKDPGVDGELRVSVARQRGGRSLETDVRFSTTIANKVQAEAQALRATVHSESEALELGRSVYDLKLRAVMCVPLVAPESTQGQAAKPPSGVLYVDSRAASRQFNQADLSLFAALAQHISIAMENARLHFDSVEKIRLEQSLELASAIQRDLMPKVPRDHPAWDVHGWYGPAEGTGGDFYDFVRSKGGRLAIVVGDVTGHGIGPALITATAQASLRSYLRLIEDAGEVVTLLNQDLCERVEDGRFLTLFLGILSDDGRVDALNGGHSLPFVWRGASVEIETIASGGPALGMIENEVYEAHEPLHLASGDVLVAYTDGLIEARDPNEHDHMFGEEGVRRVLAESAAAGHTAKEIALDLVNAAMQVSSGIREDDITVVVARRK